MEKGDKKDSTNTTTLYFLISQKHLLYQVMEPEEIETQLIQLLAMPSENEIVEFKKAKNDFTFNELGKYFSAISNEARLKDADFGWLVFGIEDKSRNIIGTNYRRDRVKLEALKHEVANETNHNTTFNDIYELRLTEGRVLMFQIPACILGFPTTWKGHAYGRDGESLVALNLVKRKRIEESIQEDWSAGICHDASIDDLDPQAILKARENYKVKFPEKVTDVDTWDDTTFLNKAKLTIKGNITKTAIILLGKAESEHFISPAVVQIRWILKDSKGSERAYKIESCPFLLAVDKIYSKIRNLRYRYIKDGTLFPDEVDRYEPFVIYEAINNCIAHQDYTLGGRINVVEEEDQLIFTNLGNFIPGSVEKVIKDNAPEEKYRNKFLTVAMFNLNMVDTIGSGIRRMFDYQRIRFFPLPEYDISNDKVKVNITGKVLDMDYASVLARDPELTLDEIIMLDKVQKKKRLLDFEARHLQEKGLIEGRKPNYIISVRVAQSTGQKAEYTKAKGFDRYTYFELIKSCIRQHGFAERRDIDRLLWNVLPEWMDSKQKKTKINHLLTELSTKKHEIKNTGSYAKPIWILTEE